MLSVVAGLALAACGAQDGYKINGTVKGMDQATEAYLLSFENNKVDTLATAPIKSGKFSFNGNEQGVKVAYVMFNVPMRGGVPVFLEDKNITITLDMTNPANTGAKGGALHDLFNQFQDIQKDMSGTFMSLQQAYGAAMQANDQAKIDSIQNVANELMEQAQAKELELMKANADSYVTAWLIAQAMTQMELEDLKARFDILSEAMQASDMGKQIAERIAKLEKTAVGATAPDFELTDPEGNTFKMYDVKAKVKLLDFWASWCGPCRGENPNVVKIYNEFHKKGLEIIGISLDNDKEAWLKAIEDDGLIWKHGSDLKGWQAAPAQLYGVSAIPATFLLDENNKIVAKNLRGDELKAKIAELLK